MARQSTDVQVRLGESAAAVRGYFGQYRDEVDVRDRIIMEALDAGWAPSKVARWAGVTPQRITQIVARRGVEAA